MKNTIIIFLLLCSIKGFSQVPITRTLSNVNNTADSLKPVSNAQATINNSLQSSINTNTSNIATNASNVSTNTSNITTNSTAISTNTSNIATNTANIATNTGNISTNTSNIATATNTANNAVSIANTANLQGVRLGAYNASTNTPTLTTDASAVTTGGFYDVTVSGTQSITGTSITYVVGDRIAKVGSVWVRLPFLLAETNKYKIAQVFRSGGDLSINTTTRTLTVTGTVYVLRNNTYSAVNSQTSTAWLSPNISGINYILFNHTTNQFAIVNYSQSGSIDIGDYAIVGNIGTDGSGKLQVNIFGTCLVDGVGYPLTSTPITETNKYKTAKIIRSNGDLSINTTARTLTVTGEVFVLRNNTYSVVSSQASTAWLSGNVGGINYILFNHSTNQFAIVRYDQSSSIDINNYALVGYIGNDVSGKLQVNIEGSCLVDGVTYPLVPVQSSSNSSSQTAYHTPLLGALDNQGFDTDYSHIIFYGQSLSAGSNAEVAITTTAETDSYMMGDRVWITKGNNNALSLSPLVASMYSYWGESPAISTANAFKRLFDNYHRKGTQTKFITTNAGDGGKSIELLSKECTNGFTLSNNLYQSEFILSINRAKLITNGLAKTISCPSIVYMQGENNYINGTGQGLTSGNAVTDKASYKAYLLTLKNNMQADIMATYGQTKKPLFFIYQTAGSYIVSEDMPINVAQLEFANENADVILLNPTYQTPDYANQHLTANGYRMYGELIAKSLYRTLIKGEKSTGVVAKKVTITSNYTLEVDFLVPVMPLAFDVLTTDAQTNMGFKVRNLGVDKAISSTVIVGNKVVITTTTPLASGSVEVAYAGLGRNGQGNLRDSDTWASMYNYYDDSALIAQPRYNPKAQDGTNLYGKKYPCYNFCSNFYFTLTY